MSNTFKRAPLPRFFNGGAVAERLRGRTLSARAVLANGARPLSQAAPDSSPASAGARKEAPSWRN